MVARPSSPVTGARGTTLVIAGLAAILATQLVWIKRTNFTGFDEWLIIDLVSRGIADIPYANRALELIWLFPSALYPYSLAPYAVLHGAYCFSSGLLVFLLARRLAPGRPFLWPLTAVFAIVWGPGDLARLSTLERTCYAAFTFGMLSAIWLLVESSRLRSVPLLAFGTLMAFLVTRSYEAVVPLLCVAPLLLLYERGEHGGGFRIWVVAWEGVLALALLLIGWPILFSKEQMHYQLQVLGLDLSPARVGMRLLWQYLFHLAPVVLSSPRELLTAAVPVAALTFAGVAFAWVWWVGGTADGPETRCFYARSTLVGLTWAGLGYGMFVLTPVGHTALRMQFLSAPGIALCLASIASLVATFFPPRWRLLALGVMGAWVVAVGAGRTVAMQEAWDAASAYPSQMRMLGELTRQVPDVKPHTLIVLLDQGKAWRASYGFRHAVQYLYQGRASGLVHGAWDALYPTFFTPEGIRVEPWSVLRAPWGARVSVNQYNEVIVARYSPEGRVDVLEKWPGEFPPVPPGERYEPESRIVAGSPPPERAILDHPTPTTTLGPLMSHGL